MSLIRKKHRSKYDAFFVRSASSAKCKLCSKEVKFSPTSGPNNLKYHLLKAHPDEWMQYDAAEPNSKKPQRDISVVETNGFPMPISFGEPKSEVGTWQWNAPNSENPISEAAHVAIMEMILNDFMPLETLQSPGFANFFSILAPEIRLQSPEYYLNGIVPNIEMRLRSSIHERLSEVQKVAITCDSWPRKNGNCSLSVVRCHWIDPRTFSPNHAVIGSCSSFSTETIEERVTSCLRNFGIQIQSVACFVAKENSGIPSVPCFHHQIQQAVRATLEEVPKAHFVVQEMTKMHGDSQNYTPSLPNSSDKDLSWSEIYRKLHWLLENKHTVAIRQTDLKFSEEEWEMCSVVHDSLEPLLVATATHSTVSTVIPSLRMFHFKLDRMRSHIKHEEHVSFMDKLATNMNALTGSYHENELLKTATFTDPRFKDAFFVVPHKTFVLGLLRASCDIKPDLRSLSAPETSQPSSSLFQQFLGENTPGRDAFEEEITEYLGVAPVEDIDPFEYWQFETRFPNLRRLAMEHLCIPSSSFEHLSRLTEWTSSLETSKLPPKQIDQLVFCSLNLKSFGFQSHFKVPFQ